MRFAVIRIWSWLATVLLAASLGDACTEFTANVGLLGGTLRDTHHEAVMPTLIAGLATVVALVFTVIFTRIARVELLANESQRVRDWCTSFACSLCGSVLVTILMEGYETGFGGVSPFDPRSVVLGHAPALLIACVAAIAGVRIALYGALRLAWRAGGVAAEALAHFLRRTTRAVALGVAKTSAFTLKVLLLPVAFAGSGSGLRAPPHQRLSPYRSC